MVKAAKAVSERFWHKLKFGNRRNTVCISRFQNCEVGAKDPLPAEDAFSIISSC